MQRRHVDYLVGLLSIEDVVGEVIAVLARRLMVR